MVSALAACTQVNPGMVYIPEGVFVMGTDQADNAHTAAEYGIIKPWFEDEHPAHAVNLPAYYVDKYEVTNSDYQVFVRATKRKPPPDWPGTSHPTGLARWPVASVSWHDADAYCLWAGKRLPTEAEWEKAARGFEGRLYPWGNRFEMGRANIGGGRNGPVAVGSYPTGQTPLGVYDLVGNVWEWTADWYRPYPGNTTLAPVDPPPGRVLKGSSWSGVGHFPPETIEHILAHNARGSFRLYADPNGRLNDVGFRCAKRAS
jgi:formylglycine-generating enzyme required for sulfatase activity